MGHHELAATDVFGHLADWTLGGAVGGQPEFVEEFRLEDEDVDYFVDLCLVVKITRIMMEEWNLVFYVKSTWKLAVLSLM